MPDEVDIEVARLVGDFLDHPFSSVHHQVVSDLLDQRALAEPLQHFRRFAHRYVVLVLVTTGAVLRPLDGEEGAVAHDPHPHHAVGRGAEIALADPLPGRASPPGVAVDQELALDLDSHALLPQSWGSYSESAAGCDSSGESAGCCDWTWLIRSMTAPGKVSRIARTSGCRATSSSCAARRASRCSLRVGSPVSRDTATSQRK